MKNINHVIVVLACGAIIWGLSGCGPAAPGAAKEKKPPRVEVVKAATERMVELLETTGDVVAVNTVMLRATTEGIVAFCPWREGDRIEKAGQKLIEIDRPIYREEVAMAEAALALAKAKLADLKAGARPEEIAQEKESVRHFADCTAFAKADMERINALVESGSLPAETVEKARVGYVKCHTQLMAANEQLAMLEAGPTATEIGISEAAVHEAITRRDVAQAKLDECLLSAPFAGVITEVLVRPGDLAVPRTPLLKMMDPTSLVVRAGLPESCAAEIREDSEVVVRLDAYPEKVFRGRIERVYPRLELDSRTRIVEVGIVDAVELIPRLFAKITVPGRVVDKAVIVPDAAIVTTVRGESVVFVVEQGKAHRRRVKVGLEEGRRVQIVDGVKAGEYVVVVGNLNLTDGAMVTMAEATEKADLAEVPGGNL